MANIDLNVLSLSELKQLQKDVAKTISSYEERKKAEARAALEERAREMGFSLAELSGAAPSRKRGPSVPKYRHPENPNITWTGRGRKPKWITDHIAAGNDIADLEI